MPLFNDILMPFQAFFKIVPDFVAFRQYKEAKAGYLRGRTEGPREHQNVIRILHIQSKNMILKEAMEENRAQTNDMLENCGKL